MNIKIQVANLQDLDELMEWRMRVLYAVFGIKNKEEYEKLFRENLKYYKKTIPTENHIAVFALLDNKKVGCGGLCLYQEMPSPDNLTGNCAYLMNIYTLEEYRHHGIAKKVIKFLIEEAQKRDVPKIFLETTKEARNLYVNLGFTDLKDYLILED